MLSSSVSNRRSRLAGDGDLQLVGDEALPAVDRERSFGEMVEIGDNRSIFFEPRHEYTRSLFAAAPGRGHSFGA